VLDSCTVPVRLAILWTKSHSARANFVQYCEYAAVRYCEYAAARYRI
jgi:hypothetical protein